MTRAQRYELGFNTIFVFVSSGLDLLAEFRRAPWEALVQLVLMGIVGIAIAFPITLLYMRKPKPSDRKVPHRAPEFPSDPKSLFRRYSTSALLLACLHPVLAPLFGLMPWPTVLQALVYILGGWMLGNVVAVAYLYTVGRRLWATA